MKTTRGLLGKEVLAYFGDTVWEFLVLKHQYMQVVRSPFTESQAVRCLKQAKAAGLLYRGSLLTTREKRILDWATSNAWRSKAKSDKVSIEQVGFEQYSAAHGLRTFLGFLYIDEKGGDDRIEAIAREVGLLSSPGEEDKLLSEVTGGVYPALQRAPTVYFLALAPLGHVALRLYISRYLCRRPSRASEFIYRVKLALRAEELDLAAVGFMRDDATSEELKLLQGARDTQDTYSFAFECLLGHLALTAPYRLHQIVSDFGWADPLPGRN